MKKSKELLGVKKRGFNFPFNDIYAKYNEYKLENILEEANAKVLLQEMN